MVAGDFKRPALWLLTPVLLLAVWGLVQLPVFQRLEFQWLDFSFKVIRKTAAPQSADDVLIIGFDEKSLAAFGKPFALLHEEFAEVLDALRWSSPKAVAVDLIFPPQNYASILPGGLQRLGGAIYQLRSDIPLFIGIRSVPPQTAAEQTYAAMAGVNGSVLLTVPKDPDGVLRRIDDRLSLDGQAMPLLATSMVRAVGGTPKNGIVDFTVGTPFSTIAADSVVAMQKNKDIRALRSYFHNKIVLVGAMFPDQDRQMLPLGMVAGDASNTVPGVVFQAQAIRSMLQQRMIEENNWLGYLIAIGGILIVLITRHRLIIANIAGMTLSLATLALSILLLAHGIHISIVVPLMALAMSLLIINTQTAIGNYRERLRIRNIFAGYVSPAILETILRGDLKSGQASVRKNLAFLFADIRGFTAFAAARSPEEVIAFLNRYYTVVTPVFHRHGGTVDKFSGDGVMVFFGAPQPSDNPARDAILSAQDMLKALAALNTALTIEGRPSISVGIGIAYGEAIIGNVGSMERHDYAATGAVVNLAAHIQQYCKKVPYELLIEESAFTHADLPRNGTETFVFLGNVDLEKHQDVRLVGLQNQGSKGEKNDQV
jgi:adenylate cyclase